MCKSVNSEERSYNQCDQMARMFVQYLAVYNNENLPNGT